MTQADLNREVSAVTGECMSKVRHMGFVPLTPVPYERDRDPLTVDWDEVEQQRAILHPV